MTTTPGPADDDSVLDVVRAMQAPRATRSEQHRRRQRLDDAIAADAVRGARRLSPVAVAVALVAASAAVAAIVVPVVLTRPVIEVPVVAVAAPAVVVEARAPAVIERPVAPMVTAAAVKRDTAPTPPRARPAAVPAVDIVAAIDAADADDSERRAHRQGCAQALRHQRDVAAIEVCRAFSRHHPDDVAVRPLTFGAGGLAEELGRFDDAIDLYTRSIVIAPFQGQSSADALKARARAHAAAGHDDEAAADLRLFLRQRPAAGFDDDVRALADRLGVR